MKNVSKIFVLVSGLFCLSLPTNAFSDELGTTGLGLGFNNVGAASHTDLSSIQINPALLISKRQYLISGGYHWPSSGEEFYSAGVIDSKTAGYAAALSYTGFMGDENLRLVDRQINLGFAQAMGALSLGISAQYIDFKKQRSVFYNYPDSKMQSISLGLGLAYDIAPGFKLGISAENLANSKLKDFAPRTYRAGVAYNLGNSFIASADYLVRDKAGLLKEGSEDQERMLFGSLEGVWRGYLRMFASYGQNFGSSDSKESLSGGVGIENEYAALYYMMAAPELASNEDPGQAINLSLNLRM